MDADAVWVTENDALSAYFLVMSAPIVPVLCPDASIHPAVLHLLSADHRTHGLDLVARLGGVVAHLGPDLQAAVPGVEGVVVLGTCNRLAILLDAPAPSQSLSASS